MSAGSPLRRWFVLAWRAPNLCYPRRCRCPTEEERIRLIGMTRSVSNADLSEMRIDVVDNFDDRPSAIEPPADATAQLVVPEAVDSIHGAITMALWAVPRIGPCLMFCKRACRRNRNAWQALRRPWMRIGGGSSPGSYPTNNPVLCTTTSGLRLSGLSRPSVRHAPPDHASWRNVSQITSCEPTVPDTMTRSTSGWTTRYGYWRTEIVIQFQNWRQNPVGLAIQLVLTRPEPTSFKTWVQGGAELTAGRGLVGGYTLRVAERLQTTGYAFSRLRPAKRVALD